MKKKKIKRLSEYKEIFREGARLKSVSDSSDLQTLRQHGIEGFISV